DIRLPSQLIINNATKDIGALTKNILATSAIPNYLTVYPTNILLHTPQHLQQAKYLLQPAPVLALQVSKVAFSNTTKLEVYKSFFAFKAVSYLSNVIQSSVSHPGT